MPRPSLLPEIPVDSSAVDAMLEIVDQLFDKSGLLTLVNASPHDWELIGQHAYQMRDWAARWPQKVQSGQSLAVRISFKRGPGRTPQDSAGEARFRLEGTDQIFVITARARGCNRLNDEGYCVKVRYETLETRDIARGSEVDLGFPPRHDQGGVNWILTGDNNSNNNNNDTTTTTPGLWSSAAPPVAWMQQLAPVLGARKLKHVCVPGSHDAGMSRIDGQTSGVMWSNTQTQWLDIYHQLVRGARWLDVRPCVGNGGRHMTCHYADVLGVTQGGNGQDIAQVVRDVNRFMRDFPGELVVLDVNDNCGYDTDHRRGFTYPRLTARQWEPIIQQLRGVERACRGFISPALLYDLTMNELIGDGQGCVLILFRLSDVNYQIKENPSAGLYDIARLPIFNEYSRDEASHDIAKMGADQMRKLHKFQRVTNIDNPHPTPYNIHKFFILSWTVSPGGGSIMRSIAEMSAQAQTSLFDYAWRRMMPCSYPNVLYVDFLGQTRGPLGPDKSQAQYMQQTTSDLAVLAMAVNLHLAGQNPAIIPASSGEPAMIRRDRSDCDTGDVGVRDIYMIGLLSILIAIFCMLVHLYRRHRSRPERASHSSLPPIYTPPDII